MASRINPLQTVLERLGYADPAMGAFFPWDEVKGWPTGALEALVASGLLQKAQPATAIECDGCEESCVMPVTVCPAQEGKPGKAFITCDKRDDIGRVKVDFRRMEQWQATDGMMAAAIAKHLGISQPITPAAGGRQWRIGTFKGKKHNGQITLVADGNSPALALGGHTIPLVDALSFEKNILALDKAALIRMVDNPAGDNKNPDAEEIDASVFSNNEVGKYATTNTKPSVPASEIRWKFTVIKPEDANEQWWKKMMRNASDGRLKECRVGGGKKGAKGSLWRPDLIAVWLVDRHERRFEGMSKNAARSALKKFAGYAETAEEIFPKDD